MFKSLYKVKEIISGDVPSTVKGQYVLINHSTETPQILHEIFVYGTFKVGVHDTHYFNPINWTVPEEAQFELIYDIFHKYVKKEVCRIWFDEYGVEKLLFLTHYHSDYMDKQYPAYKGVFSSVRSNVNDLWINNRMKTLLAKNGISYSMSRKALEKVNHNIENLVKNPFSLLDIGLSFDQCANIAKDLMDEESYQQAYLYWSIYDILLYELKNQQNEYIEYTHLYSSLSKRLQLDFNIENKRMIDDAIKKGVNIHWKMIEKDSEIILFLISIAKLEESIANQIKSRLSHQPINHLNNLVNQVESQNPFKYALKQREAILNTIQNQISIITGGAGTGKSTVMKGIITVYQMLYPNKEIVCIAPTGKAAKRLSESTNMPAQTVHSLLGLSQEDNGKETKKISGDFIIIDEVSMLDIFIAEKLFSSISNTAKVVLVGDSNQLASVSAGELLSDLISSKLIPVVQLDKTQRQSEDSLISINAEKILKGDTDFHWGNNFQMIRTTTLTQTQKVVINEYLKAIQHSEDKDVCILSPLRQKKETSTDVLNALIQKLNQSEQCIRLGVKQFKLNDRVMQTVNNKKGNNGDTGKIIQIENQMATIKFDDGKEEVYSPEELLNFIELAYAITVHKSQGSEYKTVIIPCTDEHINANKTLLYTAITRSKEKCVVIGSLNKFKSLSIKLPTKRKTLLPLLLK